MDADDKTNEFVLCMVLNTTRDKVLLMLKNRSIYAGRLNGIGGHVKFSDATPTVAMIREMGEEIGVFTTPHFMMTLNFSNSIILHIFYVVINEGHPRQMEDETISWYPIPLVYGRNDLAGDGGLPYYISEAIRLSTPEGEMPLPLDSCIGCKHDRGDGSAFACQGCRRRQPDRYIR